MEKGSLCQYFVTVSEVPVGLPKNRMVMITGYNGVVT